MGRHTKARPRAGRSIYVLGTACGTLTVAALVSALHPVPAPVPRADSTSLTTWDQLRPRIDESAPAGGPLEIPIIGVVLDDYDERYAALEAARVAAASPSASAALLPSSPDPEPTPPLLPPPSAPPPPLPLPLPLPSDPVEIPPAVQEQPTPVVAGPATRIPPDRHPTDRDPAPPVPPAPPPSATDTPPVAPEVPADEELALGERYEKVDADGTVVFSITLVSVDADAACTAPGSLPARNGNLLGLQVQVQGDPSFSGADFQFLGTDGAVTADVETDSSVACLTRADAWPAGDPGAEQPAEGTIVLDVPAVTGTVVYRPAGAPAGLRWPV